MDNYGDLIENQLTEENAAIVETNEDKTFYDQQETDGSEVIQDTAVDTAEESSLKDEIKEVTEPISFKDEDVIKYLSEKLNTSVSSFDELVHKSSIKESESFASDDLKVINDYVKNTGRTIEDFMRTQRINIDEVPLENLNLAKLAEDNPTLAEDEIKLLFDEEYGKKTLKSITDDMFDEEIEEAKQYNMNVERANKLRDIKIKRDGEKAREYFKGVQEQYKLPVREAAISQFEKPSFKEALQKDVKELNVLQYDLGDEKFTYEITENQRKNVKALTPSEFIDSFKKSDGTFDVQRWNAATFEKQHISDLVKSAITRGKSLGREALEREMKNTTLGKDYGGTDTKAAKDVGVEAIMDTLYGNKMF